MVYKKPRKTIRLNKPEEDNARNRIIDSIYFRRVRLGANRTKADL